MTLIKIEPCSYFFFPFRENCINDRYEEKNTLKLKLTLKILTDITYTAILKQLCSAKHRTKNMIVIN